MFNRHRWKRQWERFRRRGSHDAAPVQSNPYFSDRRHAAQHAKRNVILAGAALIISGGFLSFHPFLSIDSAHIQVSGLSRIKEGDFRESVTDIISNRRLFVFPGNNYFLTNSEELGDILRERYPITNITIEKIFPNELSIAVEETLSTIIYDNGGRYAYIDETGQVVELLRPPQEEGVWQITSSTMSSTTAYTPPVRHLRETFGEYPILYDGRGKEIALGSIMVKEGIAEGVLAWKQALERQSIAASFITIYDDHGDAVFRIGEWDLRANVRDALEPQTEKLSVALREIKNLHEVQYIDVRYRDRVFWQ